MSLDWRARPSLPQLARRHPFLIGALLVHVLLLAGLWWAGPYDLGRQKAAKDEALIQQSVQQAQRIQLARRVQALEKLQRELAGEPPPPSAVPSSADTAEALVQRAQAAAQAIDRQAQQQRAAELAKLLKIKPEEALARVQAEKARATPPTPQQDPAQQLSAIEQLARQTAAQVTRQTAERQRRETQGSSATVARAGGSDGDRGEAQSAGPGGAGKGSTAFGGAGQGSVAGAHSALEGAGGGRFRDPRQYGALVDSAPVRAERYGTGRSFGKGGLLADRVYLNTWYIVGPFHGEGRDSRDRVYLPELGIDLDAAYAGKGGRTLRWRAVEATRYPLIPEPRTENSVYYATTELRVDEVTEVWLDIGADDDSKLWLDDHLIWTSGDADKPWYRRPFFDLAPQLATYGLVEGSVFVRLQPGRHRLVFKLYNGIDLMFFSVVLRRA